MNFIDYSINCLFINVYGAEKLKFFWIVHLLFSAKYTFMNKQSYILFVTSNHQSCFPNFFPPFFLSFSNLKKTLFIGPKQVFCQFWTNETYVSFFSHSNEKNSWKKLGKTRLVVWWFGGLMSRYNACIMQWFSEGNFKF